MVNHKTPKRNALGKGLGSLLGADMEDSSFGLPKKAATEEPKDFVAQLKTSAVIPNPTQPRKYFAEEKLKELSDSIKTNGIIQPIVVQKMENDQFQIIAGERRWRATKLAGIETIPAIIKDVSRETLMKMALIENIQREDLNVIEEALAYQSLIKEFGLSQEECAEKVSKNRSTVTNLIRLLSLPSETQEDLVNAKLSMGHGRALLSLEKPEKIVKAAKLVKERSLSVRETEKLIQNLKNLSGAHAHGAIGASAQETDADFDYMCDLLRKRLKTKVKISGSGSRGKIEISYFSASELERILDIFKS